MSEPLANIKKSRDIFRDFTIFNFSIISVTNINQMIKRPRELPEAEYITPTKEGLERRYKEYNEKYFEGVLSPCRMSLSQSKSGYGLYINGTAKSKPIIYICKYAWWTEETLEMVIVHEMVHHYVESIIKPKYFTLPHGCTFNRVCRKIKRKHGIDVRMFKIKNPYFYKEKIPTTFWGKLWRKLNFIMAI